MIKIKEILSREILDSRGNPTVECEIYLSDSSFGRSSVPSGASTGKHEAIELRDNDKKRYLGKGVLKAVKNILNIKSKLINREYKDLTDFDNFIIEIDGTKNKSYLGANATLALSIAFARALAQHKKLYFFEFLSQNNDFIMPVPLINIINGGSHADNNVDIQEFMIAPIGASSFTECIRYSSEIFYALKSRLKNKGYNTNVGDEGGFAPNINSSKETLDLILESILKAGFKINDEIVLALDVASTEFYNNNKYNLIGEKKSLTSDQMIEYLKDLTINYPIFSIEDGMSEDDWVGWKNLTEEIGNKIQLVGDDLFVTNIERLQKGIDEKSANSILIKLNQIGTITETLAAINLAKTNNYSSINYLIPFEDFEKYPLPNDIEEYKLYKYNLTNFILNRNKRIKNLFK